jgi:hypothetical protein
MIKTKPGEVLNCPALLTPFHLLAYANLKKYTFDHHFSFPVLPSKWTINTTQPVSATLTTAIEKYISEAPPSQRGFFVITGNEISPLSSLLSSDPKTPVLPLYRLLRPDSHRIFEFLPHFRRRTSSESPHLSLFPSSSSQANRNPVLPPLVAISYPHDHSNKFWTC